MTNTAFYDNMAAVAKKLLSQYGRDVTLVRTVPGAYNPSTGVAGAPDVQTYTTSGLIVDYTNYNLAMAGGLIKAGDRRLYLSATGLPGLPDPLTDAVTIDGTTWSIERATEPVNEQVIYDLQVRRRR